METIKPNYQKHIFICCNTREEGECCSKVNSNELYLKIKKYVSENGLIQKVYVTKTKCLGYCNNEGATVVIYPEGKWFLKIKNLEEIKDSI